MNFSKKIAHCGVRDVNHQVMLWTYRIAPGGTATPLARPFGELGREESDCSFISTLSILIRYVTLLTIVSTIPGMCKGVQGCFCVREKNVNKDEDEGE